MSIGQAIKERLKRMQEESKEYRESEKKYREFGMDSSRAVAFQDGHYAGYQKALIQILGFINDYELENQK